MTRYKTPTRKSQRAAQGCVSQALWRWQKLAAVFLLAFLLTPGLRAADSPTTSVNEAARGLIQRILPKQANQFVIQTIPSDDRRDVFEIESRDGKIVLSGNDAVSIASALNRYLKEFCHCDISWNCGNQLDLPRKLPVIPEKIHVVSPYQFRYVYNFCTYGYTSAWWDWPKWEHELDFLALNGINLALTIEGHEAVWIDAFTNFDYSEAAMRGWVVDPAHLPWMEMDNMENYGGPLSAQLVARRLALGQEIISRMRELGIEPVLPGYYGMVPPDFRNKFPHANIHLQGNWARLKRPDILDPTDPMFSKVAAAFYSAQSNLFGPTKFFDADPFHEGGTTTNIDVPAAGRAIQNAMGDATWVLQSWQKNPRQEMVDALNKDKTLVLDLYCEDHENSMLRNYFNRAPWLWCAINCFGGNMRTGGRLAWMAEEPTRASLVPLRTEPNRDRIEGIGALMESTGVNPVLWEMLLEGAWRGTVPQYLQPWLNDYAQRRYGAKISAAEQAWRILAETVYNAPPPSNEHTVKPAVCARPTLKQPKLPATMEQPIQNRPVTKPNYDPAQLVEAWKLLLAAAPQAKSSDGFQFDLCDVGRQVLADLSTRYNEQILTAFQARDAGALHTAADKMLGLIRDMDELAATRREWLLGVWLADARTWGATPAEKDLCERNARELLTTWTRYDNITDYANRQWNGLLGDFYFHRWQIWLTALEQSVDKNIPFDETATREKIRDWELSWTQQTNGHFATAPRGNAVRISQKLLQKYAAEASQPLPSEKAAR